jgi:uncharacterized membrane protein YphA (DoxX/SURF4 family)
MQNGSSNDTNETLCCNLAKIILSGRLVFAIAIVALGAEHLVCARAGELRIPVIPWVPGNPFIAYLTGLALLAAGVCIAMNWRARLASLFLGIFYLVCVLFLELPRAAVAPLDLSIRTAVFEPLALAAAAFTLAGLLPSGRLNFLELNPVASSIAGGLIKSGPPLFALSSIVFGIDHFLILDYIASLIPPWFPGALFWAYFTGAAFVAAGVAIATGWMAYRAALALGLMFLIWFLFLHGPRVITNPGSHNPNEWSSAFIALGMCGASWIFAWRSSAELGPRHLPVR